MTDKAYRAKEWLTRNDGLIEELKAEHDTLLMMSGKVNSAVAAYETDGANHRDIEAAKARREDALLDFSKQMERIEKKQAKLIAELNKTQDVIDLIEYRTSRGDYGALYRTIAKRRYVVGQKWPEIAELLHRSKQQLDRDNIKICELVADILAKNLIV